MSDDWQLHSCSFFPPQPQQKYDRQSWKSLVQCDRAHHQHTVIRNICFQYKWRTETCTIIFFHFCSVIYKKVFQNMKSEDFSCLSSTFIIKNNGKTPSTHTHTDARSRTETEREEELLLVASFLTSFRRSRTKTLTGRSHASWRTALQTNKEKRTGSWSWNDRARQIKRERSRNWRTQFGQQSVRRAEICHNHTMTDHHTHHRTKLALVKPFWY